MYLILTDARVRVHRLVLMVPAVSLCVAMFAPSYAGGIALRLLGIGGGFPISITVKSMPVGRQETVAVNKVGCLIIRSSSEIIVKTFDKRVPTVEDCVPSLLPGIGGSGPSPASMFSQVEVFPNSQLLQINKLAASSFPYSKPDSGTIAGMATSAEQSSLQIGGLAVLAPSASPDQAPR